MNTISGVAIFIGAGVGALLRWTLGYFLDPIFPTMPLGTLAANVLGALLMGFALGLFAEYDNVSPIIRLAVTTGFLGGLTTFSAFSAESTTLLLRGDYRWASVHIVAHVVASLVATLVGMASIRWLYKVVGVSP